MFQLLTHRFSLLLLALLVASAVTTELAAQIRDARPLSLLAAWDAADAPLTGDRRIHPARAQTFRVDASTVKDFLFEVPHERKIGAETSPASITVPLGRNQTATFRIVTYDVMAPAAAEKYPDIRAFYGVNVNNPQQSIYLDWTERGFHASVRGGGEAIFIDPLFRGDTDRYQVYRKADFDADQRESFTCLTTADMASEIVHAEEPRQKAQNACELREYRFTMTTTGEYSNYHGAFNASQSGLVQSAVVTTVNRLNQVYTRDISVRFQLVANNDLLYNYNPATDPFQNDVGDLFANNTSYTNGIIGADNYDYGHAITQGQNNGIGQFEAPCSSASRAQGASSHETPEGDVFDIDYVAHELGHNFNGRHTQNNFCNRDITGSVEPGSGSSIMGYAGICAPDVQLSSDDYFGGRSLTQMTSFAEDGGGNGCGTIITIAGEALATPSVDDALDYTIPGGTPFVLTTGGSGNGTVNFNWEQNDEEPGEQMPPVSTNEQGPMFRSLNPTPDTERYFPDLQDLLAGVDSDWEELPTVSRELDFRATVRNFNAAFGCVEQDDARLTVNAAGDPFTVTDPVAETQWSAGQTAQIQWNVAGTDAAPFNSPTVDVLLSVDGGSSFTEVLTATVNDGLEVIRVPDVATESARVLVRSVDNVFFNVNEGDFTIVENTAAPAISVRSISATSYSDCFLLIPEATYELITTSAGGATEPITWSVSGLPAGVTPTFSVNPVLPGGRFTFTIQQAGDLPLGVTNFTLTGTSPEGTLTQMLSVERTEGDGGPGPRLMAVPSGISTRPILAGTSPLGETFQVQVATDRNFTNLVYDVEGLTQPSYTPASYLQPLTRYYWRMREGSECGISAWSEGEFRTGDCELKTSSGRSKSLVANNADDPRETSLTIPLESGTITDIDVFQVDVTYRDFSNLAYDLEAPDGTTIDLFETACGTRNLKLSFDDEAQSAAIVCDNSAFQFYKPRATLRTFDGKDAEGTWRLTVRERERPAGSTTSTGIFNDFSLNVCRASAVLPVTFLDFTARGLEKHIQLSWETTDEVDNYGYYVERQTAAGDAGHWEELGFVAAGARYQFDDRSALADTDYLYRLRQTDVDGRVSYSTIETARFGDGSGTGVVLFPNPTAGKVNYRVPGAEAAAVPYRLYDVAGKLLERGNLLPEGGVLNLTHRTSGVYLLRVGDRTQRVIKR